VGFVTTGDYSEDLHELAANGAGGFLAVWVTLPSLLGMSTHWILGEKQRVALISPYLKLSNFGVLALLNYQRRDQPAGSQNPAKRTPRGA
jgi:BASS family bile acid:Na+ symporter